MSSARTSGVISDPTVSFSTFAKLMGACTPMKQASLLHGHKYPTDGPKRSYQLARAQLIDHLVNQRPLQPAVLRAYEREALESIPKLGVPVPPGAIASRPMTSDRHWTFHGVEVSFVPDVDLTSSSGCGALKVHFNKDPLPRGVGVAMAALLHHYKADVLRGSNVAPSHCLIYEARTGALYKGRRSARLLTAVQATCRLIVSLWPSL